MLTQSLVKFTHCNRNWQKRKKLRAAARPLSFRQPPTSARLYHKMSPAPESLIPVLQALSSALSPSSATRQESLSLLSSWTTLPGYYSSLVEIFCNRDLDLGNDRQRAVIRMQAVLQFKNGTDKYWRRGAVK